MRLDTANSFSSAIQSAQQDASTALSTAQTAQTTASNANNTAIQAQQDASSAVTTANNTSGQVSTLSGTVTTLGQRVTTAEGNIGQNTSDITALGQRVGTAEGNITTLQNDVTIAQGNASSAMATAGQVKQQAFVFRYSSTALTASSTNSNALLDNTDNLKVGDKVIDSSGVLFSITAIDTQNSTFTIGTALIDLAQDSDVVHKSGNETISGVKTITDTNLEFKSTSAEYGVSAGDSSVIFKDKNNRQTFKIYSRVFFSGVDNNLVSFFLMQKVDNTYYTSNGIQLYTTTDNKNATLRPILANSNTDGLSVSLGASDRRWSKIYGTEYYYGSNNVEFSTKFVTTDTAQTISGNKTFSSINGVEPSSLSLPSDRSARIDISSYFTNTGTGDTNTYTVPANGYIYMDVNDCVSLYMFSQTTGNLSNYGNSICRNAVGRVIGFLPVRKDDVFTSQWYTSATNVTLASAFFIPCQGNV